MPRIYLAGPDVFLPEPGAWAARRKNICRQHGLLAVSPFDAAPGGAPGVVAAAEWQRIFLANEAHIRGADAVIANLTPFRGPSADPGTVYEIGLARGLGKQLFGYSTTTAGLAERSAAAWGPTQHDEGVRRDRDGLVIEDFALFDNLMVVGGLTAPLVAAELPAARRWSDLTVFARCVAVAARMLGPA